MVALKPFSFLVMATLAVLSMAEAAPRTLSKRCGDPELRGFKENYPNCDEIVPPVVLKKRCGDPELRGFKENYPNCD
ncbi:hypothetical protein EMPS_04515 [Entomortierella parvispora]|uniref:Uncharacterized protein n=1 Tax=Entomortierella parvispora TaxID=205924 RepID=A0A9P3LVJ3_9FUNG|nr:hypothetical protein EMPS_04515 [Entomortierella parvispora]